MGATRSFSTNEPLSTRSHDAGRLRDQLELSDSALSKQLSTLEEAGYVSIDRPLRDRRRRVRARLTEAGRAAFEGHVAALQQIVGSADLDRVVA